MKKSRSFLKEIAVPAAAFALLLCAVPAAVAAQTTTEKYNPAKTLLGASSQEESDGLPEHLVPKKTRTDTLSLAVAPEYFFDFGSDLPGGDGWGASLAVNAHFNTDTPQWDFIFGAEFLGFGAESGKFTKKGARVTEQVYSANLIVNFGLSRTFGERFALEAQAGIGLGLLYDEVKGDNFKRSSSGDWTMPFSLKILGEYRIDEHWGVFLAYRAAYISPSILSQVADWHDLDLIPQSLEFGVRVRF